LRRVTELQETAQRKKTEDMNDWKKRFVEFIVVFLAVSFTVFVATGYTALYWAWTRGNLEAARPYLSWARNFGALAVAGAALAFAILFSSRTFAISAKTRLLLSLLATATVGFFSEFRNEGKFYFKGLHHFFGPGTWIHHGLNQISPAVGDFLYRIEFSHWNDFLLGPAIVSILFPLAIVRIYKGLSDQASLNADGPRVDISTALEQALRFARILMCVGLFWFFWQAWAEKAGYLSNPHSSDEVDLPFEFGGTVLGFWMARVLTKPFGKQSEKFRSTVIVDFVSSGVIGLLYTLIVGPLIEGVSSAVGHSLYPVVPRSLEVHEYTSFQRHIRPLELFLIAGATWWSLNQSSKSEEMMSLGATYPEPEADAKWNISKTMLMTLGAVAVYLAILAIMFSLLEPQGLGWTLTTAGTGLVAGTVAFLLVKWAGRHGVARLLGKDENSVQ
jgi:hypothetical protein